MNIVVDTNIFLASVLDEPEKQHIIELTVGSYIVAPTILPYEIGNALTALVKRTRLPTSFYILQSIGCDDFLRLSAAKNPRSCRHS